jgi:hypothetical protein
LIGEDEVATSDRRPYLVATTLTQNVLDEAAGNLEFGLEMVADIDAPGGTMRVSDRNKYVGGSFYPARVEFPAVKRTLGEWLSPELEFSRLELTVSNVDGTHNHLLPGGANFAGWIGRTVDVRLGLRDVAATYETVYRGRVTDVGGMQRSRTTMTLVTRDEFDRVNVEFPKTVLTKASFPDLEEGLVGTVVPVVYGDWTVALTLGQVSEDANVPPEETASVPAYPLNGEAPGVLAGADDVELIVSDNDLSFLDTANVWLYRNSRFFIMDSLDVTAGAGNRFISIAQGGASSIDGDAYEFQAGDIFYVRAKGKDLGAYDDNIVAQAEDLLKVYGGLSSGDFDANWAAYRDKATPAESAVALFKSRVWVQERVSVLSYVLSMLEQVRLEMFVSRGLKFKLASLHLDDFVAAPSFSVRQWDLQMDSFRPVTDERNVWNRARADYAYDPQQKQNRLQTPLLRNQAAITQMGKEISKKAVFPNLYDEGTVLLQLTEMIKLASASSEMIELTLTPRAALRDLGEFVAINLAMGSTVLENVPAMVREIGFDPKGMRVTMKVWSMQMVPFPGYTPTYPLTAVGGSTASITQET